METSKPYEVDVPLEVPEWTPCCTPGQMKDFIESAVWREIAEHVRNHIFEMRNLLETGNSRDKDDIVRGQLRESRDMLNLPQVIFQSLVDREQKEREDAK